MTTSDEHDARLAEAVDGLAAVAGGARAKAAADLAALIREAPDGSSLSERLSTAEPTKAQRAHWRAVAASLNRVSEALNASETLRAQVLALKDALTAPKHRHTQPVVARTDRATKRATGARSRRSRPVADSTEIDAKASEIVAELSSKDLSTERQSALLQKLADRSNGFSAAETVQIAKAVTGNTYASGKSALAGLEKWTWKRVQARKSTDDWAETSSSRL